MTDTRLPPSVFSPARPQELRALTYRSPETGAFEFVKVSALRAAQLMKGCAPRVPHGHKFTTTAQREVAAGKVFALPRIAPVPGTAGAPGGGTKPWP